MDEWGLWYTWPMKKLYPVHLHPEQQAELERLISTGTHSARQLARARILLLADQGRRDPQIMAAVLVSRPTVERTRQRFVTEGLDTALHGHKPPGRPPQITGEVEAQLVLLACSAPPPGAVRWTLQLLAERLVELHVVPTISDEQVRLMLKKTNLSLGGSNAGASRKRTPAS